MRHLLITAILLLVVAETPAESPATANFGISKTKPANGISVQVPNGYMIPYTVTIPGTEITFEMVPVPGGTFMLGSPADEEGRSDDEGPQVKVAVDPMWVAKHEVTWTQYKEFMGLYKIFKEMEKKGTPTPTANHVDAVTAPTPLYEPSYTYEYVTDDKQPAVTMSQYSAQQFTKWLSRLTGLQFRLPTEAEWEYAAKAGSKTAYFWGDGVDELDDYAWFFDNSDEGAGLVGTKKPNAFGLHDMLGNAAEWTINQYTEDGYKSFAGEQNNATTMALWPVKESPCVVRGGSWEQSDALRLRCAARLASDYVAWKDIDPMFPKSPWWITDDPARGVGMRVFQSYKSLDEKTIRNFWRSHSVEINFQVNAKIDKGRGARGLVNPSKTAPTNE